jgi:hypothetical protein
MLITAKGIQEGLVEYKEAGSKFSVRHVERMDEIFAANKQDRMDDSNGFSKERHFRQIGRMGNLDLARAYDKYPELLQGDRQQKDRAWRKILTSDPEFEHCRTVRGGI